MNPISQNIRVRIRKADGTGTDPATAIAPGNIVKASSVPGMFDPNNKGKAAQKHEPKVQMTEVSPGVFDIHFDCSCGEHYVIKCEALEKDSTK